jgi:hypothetical protein
MSQQKAGSKAAQLLPSRVQRMAWDSQMTTSILPDGPEREGMGQRYQPCMAGMCAESRDMG